MTQKIETVARNMRLTDNIRDYVEKKAAKLERFLQEIDEIRENLRICGCLLITSAAPPRAVTPA